MITEMYEDIVKFNADDTFRTGKGLVVTEDHAPRRPLRETVVCSPKSCCKNIHCVVLLQLAKIASSTLSCRLSK